MAEVHGDGAASAALAKLDSVLGDVAETRRALEGVDDGLFGEILDTLANVERFLAPVKGALEARSI
jgi:hypothetical protein